MHLWTNSENLSLADQQSFLPLFSLSRRVIPFNLPFHPWQSRTHRLAVKRDCVHCVTRAHEAVKKKKIHRINKLELLDLDLVGYFWPMLCIRDTIMSIFFRLFYMCSWWRAGMRRGVIAARAEKNKPRFKYRPSARGLKPTRAPQTLKYLV